MRSVMLILIGVLLLGHVGGLIPCPETKCCTAAETSHDPDCGSDCPPCLCCMERGPADVATANAPGPSPCVATRMHAVITKPPVPDPTEILKIPKASLRFT